METIREEFEAEENYSWFWDTTPWTKDQGTQTDEVFILEIFEPWYVRAWKSIKKFFLWLYNRDIHYKMS